jgi:hypothetical protein
MRLALLLAVAAMACGGCTSMSQTQPAARDDGIDRGKMAVVETVAERSGVRVYWVNPPRKSSP